MNLPQFLQRAISWLSDIKHKSKFFQIAGLRLVSNIKTTPSSDAIVFFRV
ncbi:hypothetical protein Hanom_Chr13g01201321 [Helianthus anomalus]